MLKFFNFKVIDPNDLVSSETLNPSLNDTSSLPRTDVHSMRETADRQRKLEQGLKLQNMRILVVEDCPDQQRLIVNMLSNYGASVYLECNGEAAAADAIRAKLGGRPFDAVIMDLYLESSNGIDATRRIVTFDPHALVIAITANGSPEIEREWREAGCIFYLEKPIPISHLVDALACAVKVSA